MHRFRPVDGNPVTVSVLRRRFDPADGVLLERHVVARSRQVNTDDRFIGTLRFDVLDDEAVNRHVGHPVYRDERRCSILRLEFFPA